jgi:hypothetical protein
MSTTRCSAIIEMREINCKFKYDNIDVMTLRIKYPIVNINNSLSAQEKINNQISIQVDNYLSYVRNILYDQAINYYRDSLKNNFPFFGYEVFIEYVITYNDNCFLSLYSSNYEFTGGAHGSTRRVSNTWELCTGESIYLNNFFEPSSNYTRMLIQEMIKQAEKSIIENELIYFEDYRELIAKYFNPINFFMSPTGITIYYHQYDIGPYSTGIVEFTIPYEKIGWFPSC